MHALFCWLGGGEPREKKSMARNALVRRMQLGHDKVEIRYLIVGPEDGVPLVMTPGGQSSSIDSMVGGGARSRWGAWLGGGIYGDVASEAGQNIPDAVDAEYLVLARQLASEHGFRVLLHDRVNTGGSSFYLGRTHGDTHESEHASSAGGRGGTAGAEESAAAEFRGDGEPRLQAFFLRELMVKTGFGHAFLWGSSAGSRMSCHLAEMFPQNVCGLILCNITAGSLAARTLAHSYYSQFLSSLPSSSSGGDPPVPVQHLVQTSDLYYGLVQRRPANAAAMHATAAAEFAETLCVWADFLLAGDGDPIVGTSSRVLQKVTAPAIVVFDHGTEALNDGMHTPAASRALASALVNCKDTVIDTRKSVWLPRVVAFTKEH